MAALVALTQRLEGARFRDFWLAQDACRDVVAGVAGFYEAACPQPLGYEIQFQRMLEPFTRDARRGGRRRKGA